MSVGHRRSRRCRTLAALAVGATPNTERPLRAQVVDGGAQGGGLAGAGGSDDEDELVVAGDGRRGVGLEDVEARTRRRWSTVRLGWS